MARNHRKYILAWSAAALLAGALATPPATQARTVYRCGTEYQATPCTDGGRALELNDTRSPLQRAEAESVAQAESALARSMQRERERQAKAQHPPSAIPLTVRGRPAEPNSAKASRKQRSNQARGRKTGSDEFTAMSPGSASRKPRKSGE